jgi:hypothetical protein
MDGANDLLGDAGIVPTIDAIYRLVRDALHRGVRVMLTTLPPQRESGRRGFAAPMVRPTTNSCGRSLRRKNGVILVDLYPEVPRALVGEDGLHLTEEGYRRPAEIFRDAIAGS